MRLQGGLRIGDVCLIAVLLVTAVLLLLLPFLSARGAVAEIVIVDGGEVRSVSLEKNARYEVVSRGVHLTVCVEDGRIFVSESDCRDAVCRNTPPISRAGQSIVCAPAGVVVRISGEEVLVDGVSG